MKKQNLFFWCSLLWLSAVFCFPNNTMAKNSLGEENTIFSNLVLGADCSGATDINSLFGQTFNMPQTSILYDNTGLGSNNDPTFGFDCWQDGGGPTNSNSIWYSFTGDGNTYDIRAVECTAVNYNNDTQMAIYSGDCNALTGIDCNEDEGSTAVEYNAKLTLATTVGVTYYVMIDGYDAQEGEFCLEVTNQTMPPVMTTGEDCSEAHDINSLFGQQPGTAQISSLYNNTGLGSNNDPTFGFDCWQDSGGPMNSNSIWYSFTGDGNTYDIRVVECTAVNYNNDTQMAIYSGDCNTLTGVDCNEDEGLTPAEYNAKLTLATTVGEIYYVMIDGFDAQQGDFCLEVTQVLPSPLPGNECADAIDINALFGATLGDVNTSGLYDNTNATSEAADPAVSSGCFYNNDPFQKTLWYTFTGNGEMYNIKSVECSATNYIPDGDTQVAIYAGDCMNPVFESCNDDEGGSSFNFNIYLSTVVGVEYRMVVDGFDGISGEYCLQVTNTIPPSVPSGNECADAIDINSLFGDAGEVNTSTLYDNTNATSEASDPATSPGCFFNDDPFQKTLWYTFTGDGQTYRIKSVECNATNYITSGDTQASLYSGDCMNPVFTVCNGNESGTDLNFIFELATEVGLEYRMLVDGFGGLSGEFCLEVSNLTTPAVFPNLTAVCLDAGTQIGLGAATPTGGTYSGTGVMDDGNGMTFTFNPSETGAGTHNITYTATSGATATATIQVNDLPMVTFTVPGPFTVDAGTQAGLGGGTPEGGVYSGTGVTDGGNGMTYSFDPTVAGVGSHTITYSFTDANTCSNAATGDVTVEEPALTNEECGGATDVNALLGGPVDDPQVSSLYDNTGYDAVGDPTEGFDCWFDSDEIQNSIWYTFTGDGNSYRIRTIECVATSYNDDTQVAIYTGTCSNPTPVACNDDEDEDTGILNISIDIATETGVEYLMLIDGYDGTEGDFCLEVTNLGMEVLAFPALDALCEDAAATEYSGATPEGGTYSGPGVTDDGNGMTFTFDPATAGTGTHTITYTSSSGLTTTSSIEVLALPTVSLTAPVAIDINDGVQSDLGGGTPTGGVYSGSGVTDDGNGMTFTFDPTTAGVGDHPITYSFTDGNSCNNTATGDVTVTDMVDVDNLIDRSVYVYPNPTSGLVYFKGDNIPSEVKVIDALGRLLSNQSLLLNEVDLSEFPSGVYTLLVSFENEEQGKVRVVKE